MRETVGGDTLNIRAICAAVFRPEITASAISRRLVSSSFLRRPPIRPSALCRRQAGRGALADHGALELSEGADHLHHHPPGRRGGVDVLGERAEAGTGLADLLHDVQQVLQRTGQPVEFQTKTLRAEMDAAAQAGPTGRPRLSPRIGGASRGTERGALLGEVLALAGDAPSRLPRSQACGLS